MGTILSEGDRKKTRCKHWCCVCDKEIPAGSPAHFQSNVGFDWGLCTVYWHMDCVSDFSTDF
jgi:hypothetical protein